MRLPGSIRRAHLKSVSHRPRSVPRCRAPIELLVTSGKSAQSDLSCLSTTAIDEPRELARMDCPPGLLVGPRRLLQDLSVGKSGAVPHSPTPSLVRLALVRLALSRKSESSRCLTSEALWPFILPHGQSVTKGLIRRGSDGEGRFNNPVPWCRGAAVRRQSQIPAGPVPDGSRSSHPFVVEGR